MKYAHARQHKPQPAWTPRMCKEFCPYVFVQLGSETLPATTGAGAEGADVRVVDSSMVFQVAWATVAAALNQNTPIQL